MRRGKDISGLPIISFDTGKKLATVTDLLLDPEQKQILALTVAGDLKLSAGSVIPYQQIKAFGRDAVIVEGENSIVQATSMADLGRALRARTMVAGLRLLTEDGRNLGTIGDVYFDETTGQVRGFEVSRGTAPLFPPFPLVGPLFGGGTMPRGKLFVPLPATMRIGKDVVFVPAGTTAQAPDSEEGLLPGFEVRRPTGEDLVRRFGDELERFGELALRAAAEQQKKFAIGKVADRAIVAPDGTQIVDRGEIIDSDAADEAERLGVLNDLALAAGASVARDAAGVLRNEARRMFGSQRVSKTRGRVEVTGGEETEARETEEARIDRIIGGRSQRVILDQDETIILNTGDVITHESVDRARQAGMLDELLAAQLMEEPTRSEHERREHTPGEIRYDKSEEAGKKPSE